MQMLPLENLQIEKIPRSPGLYFFIGAKNEVLYVGKAANLRERLRSYFPASVSEKIWRLRQESKKLKVLALDSEIDALLKEANFIKKNRPKYNVLLRDDKNYFFAGFTKEEFPRIFLTHQPSQSRNLEYLGPYVSGRAIKVTLRLIRRAFPYCTCRTPHARICIQSQLGLCPGYCCQTSRIASESEKREYDAHIADIRKVLTGKHHVLQKELCSALHSYSQQRRFEEAAKIRDQILGLKRVMGHRGLIQTFEMEGPQRAIIAIAKLQKILGMPKFPVRIECYDASEISGRYAVGAMTAFINGEPQKTEWRLFKIKRVGEKGDPAHLKEILTRRLSRRDWALPGLIIIDGSKTQLAVAERALENANLKIPAAAIAKGEKRGKNDRLIWDSGRKIKSLRLLRKGANRLLAHIRNETHKFAISYHRKLRRSSLVG